MGGVWSSWAKARSAFGGDAKRGWLMVGLDAAGKTTILYNLRLGEVVSTFPTIGWNIETVSYKSTIFTAWDVGGRSGWRSFWRHYYKDITALIFVVDSNDLERLEEAKDQLQLMLQDEQLGNIPVLVFANKQDLPGACSTARLAEELGLNNLRGRQWFIQAARATASEGLYEGLEWLASAQRKGSAAQQGQKMQESAPSPSKEVFEKRYDDDAESIADTASTAESEQLAPSNTT